MKTKLLQFCLVILRDLRLDEAIAFRLTQRSKIAKYCENDLLVLFRTPDSP